MLINTLSFNWKIIILFASILFSSLKVETSDDSFNIPHNEIFKFVVSDNDLSIKLIYLKPIRSISWTAELDFTNSSADITKSLKKSQPL